jgi:excisionase family DNA binding protein
MDNLSDYMSVQEAAKRLGVSEKSIYRYLEKKKLTSQKIGITHLIPRSQVEKLALSRHVQKDEETHMRDRVNTLYELVGALDFRVRELEEKLAKLQAPVPVQTPLPTVQTAKEWWEETPAPQPRDPLLSELPAGTLTLQEFADEMDMARRTLLDMVVRYDLDHIKRPNPARPKETKRYFTIEQQEAIREWRASRHG